MMKHGALGTRLTRSQWVKAIVALVLLVGGIIVLAAPRSDAMPVNQRTAECDRMIRSDQAHENDGSTGDDEWWLTYIVNYDYCWVAGPNYAVPRSEVFVYNQEGTHMGCSRLTSQNVLLYVEFNSYLWSYAGENMNPAAIRVPCDESTTNSRSRIFENPERLHTVIDNRLVKHPRAKANYKIEKSGMFFEDEGTLYVALRECDGRGTEGCS